MSGVDEPSADELSAAPGIFEHELAEVQRMRDEYLRLGVAHEDTLADLYRSELALEAAVRDAASEPRCS